MKSSQSEKSFISSYIKIIAQREPKQVRREHKKEIYKFLKSLHDHERRKNRAIFKKMCVSICVWRRFWLVQALNIELSSNLFHIIILSLAAEGNDLPPYVYQLIQGPLRQGSPNFSHIYRTEEIKKED